MKFLLTFFLLIKTTYCLSCDCDLPFAITEFQASKFVFQGIVISKKYAKDKKTYSIVFNVDKSFKGIEQNQKLKFVLPAEFEFAGTSTSCDFHARLHEKWLIYVHDHKGKLSFDSMCSNSRCIDRSPLNDYEKTVLLNANQFDFKDYIVNRYSFGLKTFIVKAGAYKYIIQKAQSINQKTTVVLSMVVSSNGEIKQVFSVNNAVVKNDNPFRFATEFIENNKVALSSFEVEAIAILKSYKTWECLKLRANNQYVTYVTNVSVSYDPSIFEWKFVSY